MRVNVVRVKVEMKIRVGSRKGEIFTELNYVNKSGNLSTFFF